jgi:DNA (cytosine-5)-methyltransferase 1
LLDLFAGAHGAGDGYERAGFEVTGVDNDPKLLRNHPGRLIICDAFEYLAEYGHEYDVIHASPPCQRKSRMTNCRPGIAATYPNWIKPVRMLLEHIGRPYVIENVEGSDVRPDVTLCGHMFALPLYRHRVFESNIQLWQPTEPRHIIPASKAGHWKPGTIMSVSGHVAPIAEAERAMGIAWMTRDQLAEAVPPAYAEFIGTQLLAQLAESAA